MRWINVNENYLDYLRTFEGRIPLSDYGNDRYKPFFGILFEENGLYYITQVSHPQARHKTLKQQKDFYKIYDPMNTNRLIAVINLNYMFPIPKNEVSVFEFGNIDTYRSFKTQTDKSKYINLLKKEITQINTLNLDVEAREVYNNKYDNPQSKLARRCLDFKKLEGLAKNWENNQV